MLSTLYDFLLLPLVKLPIASEEIAMILCLASSFWSATHSIAIIRELETKTVDKLFWLGLTIVPFMLLLFLISPDIV